MEILLHFEIRWVIKPIGYLLITHYTICMAVLRAKSDKPRIYNVIACLRQ